MNYLSPQIAAFAKKKKKTYPSLIKKETSCGIFQEYDQTDDSVKKEIRL